MDIFDSSYKTKKTPVLTFVYIHTFCFERYDKDLVNVQAKQVTPGMIKQNNITVPIVISHWALE